MKSAFFDCFYVMPPLKKGVHYSFCTNLSIKSWPNGGEVYGLIPSRILWKDINYGSYQLGKNNLSRWQRYYCNISWKNIVKLKIDAIQRNSINNKASEQLLNSWIVFENVDSFAISPSGFLPDDFIEIENIAEVGTGKYEITFFSGCFAENNQINRSFASKDSADNIVVIAGKVRIDIRVKITFSAMSLETESGLIIRE